MFRTFNRKLFPSNRCGSSQVKRYYATAMGKDFSDDSNARPYSDIPMVKGLPVIGTLLEWAWNMGKVHEIPQKRLKEYGPIYRERIGFDKQAENVFTASLDDWEEVCRGEIRGNEPLRPYVWAPNECNAKRGLPTHILGMKGDEYARVKAGVKSLLMPVEVAKLVPMFSDVTDDLMSSFEARMKTNDVAENIRQLIEMWTLECGFATVYRTRLHLLSVDSKEQGRTMELFDAIQNFFKYFFQLEMGLPHHKLLLSKLWKKFENTTEKLDELTKHYMDEYGEYVTDKAADMSDAERHQIATSVVAGSAATPGHTALWVLIVLSNNPDIQQRLYEEITKAYDGGQLTYGQIQLPYLRGFLKEVLRLKPIIHLLKRELTEDLVLSGYHVPSGSVVNMMLGAYNDRDWYSDAERVKPERWMRERKQDREQAFACPVKHHSFGILQFGYGRRSCLGKRLAESQLYVFIAKMVYRYKIHPVKEYDTKFCLFVTPAGEVDMKLEKRH